MESIISAMAGQLGPALVVLGAALAAGIAGSGSAWGIGIANEAAAGILTEDPKKFVSSLILLALPGTQGIYGFLVAIFALLKVGIIGSPVTVTVWQGLAIGAACLPITITGFYSAIWQGKSSAAAILFISKRPEQMGKAMVLPVMCETYAVLGLLTSLLMLNGIKIG
jgi:V/A-type H+-transporting ATPase subunit K